MKLLLYFFSCLACLGQISGGGFSGGGIGFVLSSGGSITGVTIETSGAFATIWLQTTNTPPLNTYTNNNGGFLWGWNTNNILTNAPFLSISMSSPGFDSSGASNAISRTVIATREVRQVYPAYTNIDATQINGTNLVVRVALSDFVTSNDFNLSGTLNAGWFSNSVAATLSVTNLSALDMSIPKVIANWVWPDSSVISSTTITGHVVGSSQFAMNGKPLAAVTVIARDLNGHTNSGTATVPTTNFSSTIGDPTLIQEYTVPVDLSAMPDGLIFLDFIAWPNIGNTNSVLDTRLGKFDRGTPFPHTQVHVLNRTNGFASAFALIDPINGVDASGLTVKTNFNLGGNRPPAYKTWAAAFADLKATNNIISRGSNNTCSGGVLFLSQGMHYAGLPPNDVMEGSVYLDSYYTNTLNPLVTNGPFSSRTGTRWWLRNLELNANSGTNVFYGQSNYVCDRCLLNAGSTAFFDRGAQYFINCTVSNWAQGFIAIESGAQPVHLLRGNTIFAKVIGTRPFCIVGNLYSNYTSFNGVVTTTTQGLDPYANVDYGIWCFNRYYGINNSSAGGSHIIFGTTDICTNGFLADHLILEDVNNAGVSVCFHADNARGPITNMMARAIAAPGNWDNLWYDDQGTSPSWNVWCTTRGCIWEAYHMKTDTFTGTPNAARIGNWPEIYGVGSCGNYDQQKTNMSASGSFTMDFAGLNSYQPQFLPGSTTYWTSKQMQTNWVQYYSNKAAECGAAGVAGGGGDYHLKTTSPAANNFRVGWYGWPYDLDGAARSTNDPPGGYVTTK